MEKINKINMAFYTKEKLSIPQMRSLLLNLTSDFLDEINAGENSQDYLNEYPFKVDRLNFSIYIFDKNKKWIKNPGSSRKHITFAVTSNNKIRYFIVNEEKNGLQNQFEETYYEGLQRVNQEDY